MPHTIRSLMQGWWQPSAWHGSTAGRSGSASNSPQSGSVSRLEERAQISPLVTECPYFVTSGAFSHTSPSGPHAAYPRGL
ncbi:hypothetical protein ABZ468_49270 [Streptomyces sp. NPDC005708]|uniref:hypothetical protein n=1 Tax=Streptomyces sp. NPDC005708 TaxID=3154564 RepID=UPI00340D813F